MPTLVSYGMGEHSIVEIADALNSGLSVSDLTFIDGTVFRTRSLEHVYDYELLPLTASCAPTRAPTRKALPYNTPTATM